MPQKSTHEIYTLQTMQKSIWMKTMKFRVGKPTLNAIYAVLQLGILKLSHMSSNVNNLDTLLEEQCHQNNDDNIRTNRSKWIITSTFKCFHSIGVAMHYNKQFNGYQGFKLTFNDI